MGWTVPVRVEPASRGATAHLWRVVVGAMRYALKVGGEEPSAAALAAEVAFVDHARAAGGGAPALHADRSGSRAFPGPDGTWLRLYDWVDARPADLDAPGTPEAVGALLARLHAGAAPMPAEVDGSPPDAWYDRPPAAAEFEPLLASDAWWVPRLSGRIGTIAELVRLARPADPARLVLCHRDLHPGNVLVDGADGLMVLDNDDLGPADPGRELARALFDWWSDPEPDLGRMRAMYVSYVGAGGLGRVRHPADCTMLVASRLNFLLRQLRVSVDPTASTGDRSWADQEIDESLRILPTPSQISQVIAALAAAGGERPAR